MDIKDLQRNWDELGKIDPLWSILTWPNKKGKWDIDEFFTIGKREIDLIMEYIKSLGFNVPRRKALDFGCGIGRLTQPLANYFDEVYGVDIAPSMIELANKFNQHGDKCKYYLNETDDLKVFPDNSFNFIYTNITLQHMAPTYSKNYIKEFLRILVPDGLLIFQLPSGPAKILEGLIIRIIPTILLNVYRRVKYGAIPEMHWMKREDVVKFLEQNGAVIVDIKQDQSACKDWVGFRYCVMKK
ncbi:class I SAM-dependent methyltransferase [candidate division KSB1 bacterium]|nr:class I SAM-dependent methyltransferase [candidate division KSB1 bacterium]